MVFEKLYKFIGKDIKSMMERPEGHYCLRLHKQRVYYVSEALMKKATNVSAAERHAVFDCLWCLTKLWGKLVAAAAGTDIYVVSGGTGCVQRSCSNPGMCLQLLSGLIC